MKYFFRLIPYWTDLTNSNDFWRKNSHDINVRFDQTHGREGLIMWHPYRSGSELAQPNLNSKLNELRLSNPNYRLNNQALPGNLVIAGDDSSSQGSSGHLGKYDLFICPDDGVWNISGIMKITTRETQDKNKIDSLSIYLGLPSNNTTDELPTGFPAVYDGSCPPTTVESNGVSYTWYDFQNHARGGNYPKYLDSTGKDIEFEWMHHVEKTFYFKKGQALRFAYYAGAKCTIVSDADRSLFSLKKLI